MSKYPNQAFFGTSSKWFDDDDLGAAKIFHDVATSAGFRPVHYTGLSMRVRTSNVDREARNDFDDSVVIVLFLGEPKAGSDWQDNWALAIMAQAIEQGTPCFVYTSANYPADALKQHGLESVATKIANPEEFRRQLASDLSSVPKNV